MSKMTWTLACGCTVLCGWAADSVRVGNPDELHAAVDRALKDPSAPREIVLKEGDYFLTKTVLLKGAAASNFTFRGEKPGTVRLYGGMKLSGWTKETSSPFYFADVPGWKAGESVPFRSLVKGGEWAPNAVYPGGTNRLEHLGTFAPHIMSSLAGGWSRKPTHEEFVTMPYRAEDLPDAMALENADIRLYHMWSDSICTVSNVDRKAHVLWTKQHPAWAMGACNRRQYEVLNVREGMKEPGQWYLDRTAGRVYYWPKAGEDMAKLTFVVPTLKSVFRIDGGNVWWGREKWLRGVTIRDLEVAACTPAETERASFGGSAISAAVTALAVRGLTVENVRIRNVGGAGLYVQGSEGSRVADCDISFVGARGAGFEMFDCGAVERNRIADVGRVYRASCGMSAGGSNTCYCANEICRIPYCGIIGGGTDNRYLTNYIHHVMQVLHDGGAIYGGLTRCVLRGNVVHDIVSNGAGYGVHAYYADEGSRDCVVEDNYAEGVQTPIHNHMTFRTTVRNNTLVNKGDVHISFARSMQCAFSNNTIVCGGKLSLGDPDAVPNWSGNFAVRPSDPKDPASRRQIGPWDPERPQQKRKWTPPAERAAKPPVPDGVFAPDEWPASWLALDRTTDRRTSGFSTANVRFSWDDDCLYASMLTANFKNSPMSVGDRWGKDDGVELAFANGLKVRAFFSGKTEVLSATPVEGVRVWAGRDPKINMKQSWTNKNVGHYEFVLPWKALGLAPKAGLKVPFNAFAYVSEFGQVKCWEGTDPYPDGKPAAEPAGTIILKEKKK